MVAGPHGEQLGIENPSGKPRIVEFVFRNSSRCSGNSSICVSSMFMMKFVAVVSALFLVELDQLRESCDCHELPKIEKSNN